MFSGSTREYPIAYNYGTAIFYGDPVVLTNGFINIATLPVNTTNTTVGIFLGCSYTDPVTKQKRFSQYYPANTSRATSPLSCATTRTRSSASLW